MIQFALAERLGVPDVDALANSLTKEQLEDWLIYGMANGWFRHLTKPPPQQTPEDSKQAIARIYG